jgi:hypothetical protein
MAVIRVDPDELNTVSGQLNASMRDMDQSLRHAVQQLSGIRDRAKGLDDIRNRAANLYRMHVNHMQEGTHVQQHISQSAMRFSESDRELSSMISHNAGLNQSLWQKMLNTNIVGNISIDDVLGGIQKYTGMLVGGSTTGALGFFIKYGPKLAHLTRTDLFNHLTLLGRKLNFVTKTFSLNFAFVGKMQNLYKSVKDFIPHGNLKWMQNLKVIGKVAVFADTIVGAVKTVDHFISAVRTGDFRSTWKQFKETAATAIVDSFVYAGLGLAAAGVTIATGTVAAKVALVGAAAIVTSEIVQGSGRLLASGLDFFGKKDAAKWINDSLPSIDLKQGTINKIKGVIDGVEEVVTNPRASLQNSVDFLSKKKDELVQGVSQASKKIAESANNVVNDLKAQLTPEKILDLFRRIPQQLPCPPQPCPRPDYLPPWILR